MAKPFRKRADRQGIIQPGKSRRDNEYTDKQRNPEPTTNITEPLVVALGKAPARFDTPRADGDNRALSSESGTEAPFVPMPHETPAWSESPEGNFMRIVELLATNEVAGPDATRALFVEWIEANQIGMPDRGAIIATIDFFAGRLTRSVTTALDAFHAEAGKRISLKKK